MALTLDDFIEKWWRLARNVPMTEMKADLEEMILEAKHDVMDNPPHKIFRLDGV